MNLSKEEIAVLLTVVGETLRDAHVSAVFVQTSADGAPWFTVLRVGTGAGEGPTLAAALERLRQMPERTPDGT